MKQIMKPHTPYYKAIKGLFSSGFLHGMAHITGGGIEGNLSRVIPDGLCASIDLSKIQVLPVFHYIKTMGNIEEEEMLQTFNCGVGFNLVVKREKKREVIEHVSKWYPCYEIGTIERGERKIAFFGRMDWKE